MPTSRGGPGGRFNGICVHVELGELFLYGDLIRLDDCCPKARQWSVEERLYVFMPLNIL